METVANHKIKVRYIIAVCVMLFFVVNDLVFDFLFNFNGSDHISFLCTLISAIIVFYCNFKIKKGNISTQFEKAEHFIKSNFDNAQVIFSILDIVCGAISILSGVAVLGAIFKIVKAGYTPIKIIVVTNKSKSVVKAVAKFGLIWTSGRLLSNKDKEELDKNKEKRNMFKKIGLAFKNFGLWIYSNKKSLIGTLGSILAGITTAMAANRGFIDWLPQISIWEFNIMPYIAGLIIFLIPEVGVIGRGFEKIKTYFQKEAEIKSEKEEKKAAKIEAEKKAALDKKAEEYLKLQEIKEKESAKQAAIEEEKRAQELKKQQEEAAKAEEERKIAQEKAEEEQKIIARALELKAEKEREAQAQAQPRIE